jgi:hypothetical protein
LQTCAGVSPFSERKRNESEIQEPAFAPHP